MYEQQIINDYRLGLNKGIVEAPSCFYMPMRITGTGGTIRNGEEWGGSITMDRLKSEYFTPAILKHCASLPILVQHPEDKLLDSSTIKDANYVGQTIDAWYQGDEIWGLARIYDKGLIKQLGNEIGSTSPGFDVYIWGIMSSEHKKAEFPLEINHLALVKRGHWDQVEGSIGFDNSKVERLEYEKEESLDMQTPQGKAIDLKDVENPMVTANDSATDQVSAQQVPATDEAVGPEHHEQPSAVATATDAEDIEVVDDADVEIVDDEDIEIVDADDIEITDSEDIEITDAADDIEITDSEDEETIVSNDEEAEDTEREKTLDEMREVCDSAHPSLRVKMPHISKRETKRSIVSKFMSRNAAFVSPKFSNLHMTAMTTELADEAMRDTFENIRRKSEGLGVKKIKGFVPTQYGAVDANF